MSMARDKTAERSLLLAARLGAALLLALFGALRLPGLADFSQTAWLFAIQGAAALALALSPLSLPLALGLGLPLPFLARAIAFAAFGSTSADPYGDLRFLSFDWSFLPFAFLLCHVHASSVWAFRKPKVSVPAGIAFELVLLGLLSWDLARNSSRVFPFPLEHALLVGGILALGLFALLLRGRIAGATRGRAIALGIAAIPLALIAAFFAFERFNEATAAAKGGLMVAENLRYNLTTKPTLEDKIDPGEGSLLFFMKKSEAKGLKLLRSQVYAGYSDDAGFFRAPTDPYTASIPLETPPRRTEFEGPAGPPRSMVEQDFYLVNIDPSIFLAFNSPIEYIPFAIPEGSSFSAFYRTRSMVIEPNDLAFIRALLASRAPGPGDMEQGSFEFHTIPSAKLGIARLAAEAAKGAKGYHEKVRAVQAFLRREYRYSLTPGYAADGDQLSHFLFKSKKGYCTYFAFSMALMLRSLGIPSRVAGGFILDPSSSAFDIFPVTSPMAHAWVEVFYPGIGWVDFDPTSDKLAPGEEGLILGMEKSDYSKYLEEILKMRAKALEEGEEEVPREGAGMADFLATALSFWYLLLPGLLILLLLGSEAAPRVLLLFLRDPRRKTLLRYALLERECAAAGFRARRGETAKERAARLKLGMGIDAEAAQAEADRARFDPDWEGGPRCDAAFASAAASLARAKKLVRRILARFDPRFLFGRKP